MIGNKSRIFLPIRPSRKDPDEEDKKAGNETAGTRQVRSDALSVRFSSVGMGSTVLVAGMS
ncbi:hypothetical protein [Nitrosopumilus sp.]|uniref:hypothetical protein n=1 Tax=Nitrosopumilus sp. TaxID=2024843 RepID=UPI0029313DB6|nr:hypothetical protein [Nitrosopumilus sp.]